MNTTPPKTTLPSQLSQRWFETQNELIPMLRAEYQGLTPKLEQVIRILEWVRVEEHIKTPWYKLGGRPPRARCDLARAFVAKSVMGFEKTRELIERLQADSVLKRICGFDLRKALPSEATFSRAFEEFAKDKLPQRVHAALIKANLGDQLIGHISRDSTAILARETPKSEKELAKLEEVLAKEKAAPVAIERAAATPEVVVQAAAPLTASVEEAPAAQTKPKKCGRPKKGDVRVAAPAPLGKVEQQLGTPLHTILDELPKHCDWGTKKNSEGNKSTWKGYKLHIDTADCGVPISAILTSASMHDSLAAIPLATISAQRVTSCYDLMDAAYCSDVIREHSCSLNHVPLIDHNPRRGEKKEFAPHEAQRYKERSQAERTNARLKDEFGAGKVWVRGDEKVDCHLMFALLVLAADQLMRLLQ
jgi:hypothetical protein